MLPSAGPAPPLPSPRPGPSLLAPGLVTPSDTNHLRSHPTNHRLPDRLADATRNLRNHAAATKLGQPLSRKPRPALHWPHLIQPLSLAAALYDLPFRSKHRPPRHPSN